MAAVTHESGLPPELETMEVGPAALKVPPRRGQVPGVVISFVVTRLVAETAPVEQAVVETGGPGPLPPHDRPETEARLPAAHVIAAARPALHKVGRRGAEPVAEARRDRPPAPAPAPGVPPATFTEAVVGPSFTVPGRTVAAAAVMEPAIPRRLALLPAAEASVADKVRAAAALVGPVVGQVARIAAPGGPPGRPSVTVRPTAPLKDEVERRVKVVAAIMPVVARTAAAAMVEEATVGEVAAPVVPVTAVNLGQLLAARVTAPVGGQGSEERAGVQAEATPAVARAIREGDTAVVVAPQVPRIARRQHPEARAMAISAGVPARVMAEAGEMGRPSGLIAEAHADVPAGLTAQIERLKEVAVVAARAAERRVAPAVGAVVTPRRQKPPDVREVAPVAETVTVVEVTVGRPGVLSSRAAAMRHLRRSSRVVAAPEAEGPVGRLRRPVRVTEAEGSVPSAATSAEPTGRPAGLQEATEAVEAIEQPDLGVEIAIPVTTTGIITTARGRVQVAIHERQGRPAAVPVHGWPAGLVAVGVATIKPVEDTVHPALR